MTVTRKPTRKIIRKSTQQSEEPSSRRIIVRSTNGTKALPKRTVKSKKARPKGWHPEQALISTVMKTGQYVSVIEKGVTEDWFHAYQAEWTFIIHYVNRHRKAPTKVAFARRFPDFEMIGEEDSDYLVEELRQAHAKHSFMVAVQEAVEKVGDDADILEVVRDTEKKLITLHSQVDGYSSQSDVTTDWKHVFDEVAGRVDRKKKTGMAGIASSFPTLDSATGGFGPGEYWVYGARLGGGKTWALTRIAAAAAVEGHDTLYFALEQSRAQLMMRLHNLLSSQYGQEVFQSLDLMRGEGFDLFRYRKFCQTLDQHLKGHITVDDTSRGKVTPFTIAAQIEKYQPKLVIVDYIQLMNLGSDWQSMGAISGQLKDLADRYKVTILAATQINRTGQGKEPPGPDTIAEADSIGRDVDGIITMAKQSKRVLRAMLAKYRHGPDGQKWYIKQDLSAGQFAEIDGNTASTLKQEDAAAGGDDE